MRNIVLITKEFSINLQKYSENKKVILKKIFELKNFIEENWLNFWFFNKYDVKNLWNGYFRIKFIPYRIILFVKNDNSYEFVDFFKRKWKSDYKQYN